MHTGILYNDMPVCRKCNTYFPCRMKIDGESKVLNNRKYCLECSPYKSKNTRRLELACYRVENLLDLPPTKVCRICECELNIDRFGIYKEGNKWRVFSYCKVCDAARTKQFYLEFKKKAVAYKGGKCERCSYNKCLKALDFHHIEKTNKSQGVATFRVRDWELLKKELDKCQLLCANCHREEHCEICHRSQEEKASVCRTEIL